MNSPRIWNPGWRDRFGLVTTATYWSCWILCRLTSFAMIIYTLDIESVPANFPSSIYPKKKSDQCAWKFTSNRKSKSRDPVKLLTISYGCWSAYQEGSCEGTYAREYVLIKKPWSCLRQKLCMLNSLAYVKVVSCLRWQKQEPAFYNIYI